MGHESDRFTYELAVPPTASYEEHERFKPKPLDGEVEKFEVDTKLELRGAVLTYYSFYHPLID